MPHWQRTLWRPAWQRVSGEGPLSLSSGRATALIPTGHALRQGRTLATRSGSGPGASEYLIASDYLLIRLSQRPPSTIFSPQGPCCVGQVDYAVSISLKTTSACPSRALASAFVARVGAGMTWP